MTDREFLGLKFSIPGCFWVGKFGEYFFGRIDLGRIFLGYSKQSEDSWPRSSPNKIQPNLALEIRHRIFLGLTFVPGIFGRFVESPRDFWGNFVPRALFPPPKPGKSALETRLFWGGGGGGGDFCPHSIIPFT